MDLLNKILQLDSVYEGDGQQGGFETSDPKEAIREVIQRAIGVPTAQVPITENMQLNLGPNLDEASIGGEFDVGGGQFTIGGGMRGDDKAFGIGFRKQFKKGTDPDTSPVYNEKTGHIYKKGNRFGTYYSKTPGTNQYGALTRSLEEVQAIIDNAPKIKKKNKMVEMTAKDLEGRSEYNDITKGGTRYVTRKELDKYRKELKFKTTGKPVLEEQSKYTKARKEKDLARSNPAILNKLAGKKGYQLSHLSLGELDTLKNLGYLPANINIDQYHPFEKKIVAISKDIYDIQNNKDLSVSEKRMAIAQKQKEDRALRKKFPEFAKTKARLNVKATGLDESGLMIKEKLPDPSIAIAPDEAGTQFKGTKLKSEKAENIIRLAKKELDYLKPLANIGCPTKKSDGGRVNFSNGQDLTMCAMKGAEKLQNTDPKDLDGLAKSNIKKLTKTAQGARFLKNTLGPAALAYEGLFALPFAALDYAEGRKGKDILINALTLGLKDESLRKDELKEFFGSAGKGDEFIEALNDVQRLSKQSFTGTRKQKQRAIPLYNKAFDRFEKTMQPFMRVNPQIEAGEMFSPELLEKNLADTREAEKKVLESYDKRLREREIGPYSKPFDFSYGEFDALANGGIAGLSGGDKSGPPPERGPDSQGLRSLMKRGINL